MKRKRLYIWMKHQQMFGNQNLRYGNRQIQFYQWFTRCPRREAQMLP